MVASQSSGSPSLVRSLVNYIFFDEQFNAVDFRVSKVGAQNATKKHHDELGNIIVPKNGFVYIYCSNESPVDVFFDNIQVVQKRGAMLEETHYYPFGLTMNGISSKSAGGLTNKNQYNGKELQSKEFTDGSGLELYDFGARQHDPQIGRWTSVDPLAHKFSWQSPYTAMDDNPINIIDPDGQSGEPVVDKKNKTITVSQHLIFYGGKAETKLSNKIATGVAAQWNGAHGKVVVDGVKYKVNFKVTYETVTDAEATKIASGNKDIKKNFIRIEDGKGSSFTQKLGANSYYFNTDDDISGSTTPAHEIGHGLGLDHTATGGQTETDVPDIMEARGTQVNPRWSKVGPSNDVDPNFRRVDKKEVESIFKGVTFDKNGKGKIGTTTNKIYDKNGN